jgi:hypothetical protein
MNRVTVAQKAHEVAAERYARASADYETALISHNTQGRDELERELHSATEEYARTMADLVSARRSAAPTFEELLKDPTFQCDPNSIVLASIMSYSHAIPASASLSNGIAIPADAASVERGFGVKVVRSTTAASLTAA